MWCRILPQRSAEMNYVFLYMFYTMIVCLCAPVTILKERKFFTASRKEGLKQSVAIQSKSTFMFIQGCFFFFKKAKNKRQTEK